MDPPLDDDYDEVRAESPHLFDAKDDRQRQRQIYPDRRAGKYRPIDPSQAE